MDIFVSRYIIIIFVFFDNQVIGKIIRDEYPKWVGQPCYDKCLLDGGYCNNETRQCECHELTHYQESNHECRPILNLDPVVKINEYCTKDAMCRVGIKYSNCRGRRCVCDTGYHPIDGGRECMRNNLGNGCLKNSDCSIVIPGSFCDQIRMKCKCSPGTKPSYYPDVNCRGVSLLDGCYNDEECSSEVRNSFCDSATSFTCQCKFGFTAKGSRKCSPVVMGGTCREDKECVQVMSTLRCVKFKCSCVKGTYQSIGNCFARKVGWSCNDKQDCNAIYPSGVADCEHMQCVCPVGYTSQQSSCIKSSEDHSCEHESDCAEQMTCVNNICACPVGHKLFRYNECLKLRLFSECYSDKDCTLVKPSAYCDGVCKCKLGLTPVDKYTCRQLHIDDSCFSDAQCHIAIPGSFCLPALGNRLVCTCAKGFTMSANQLDNDDTVCIKRVLGDACDTDDDCVSVMKGTRCRYAMCVCGGKYTGTLGQNVCHVVKLGSVCLDDLNCNVEIENSECVGSKCKCIYTHVQHTFHVCLPRQLGSFCQTDDQCSTIENTICNIKKKCQCALDHIPKEQFIGPCIPISRKFCTGVINECEKKIKKSICYRRQCVCRTHMMLRGDKCVRWRRKAQAFWNPCFNGGSYVYDAKNITNFKCLCRSGFNGHLCLAKNYAYKKLVGSTMLNGQDGQLVVDGNRNHFPINSACVILEEKLKSAYLAIDLGEKVDIGRVIIASGYCPECGAYMANVNVFVGRISLNWDKNDAAKRYKECIDASNANDIWAIGEIKTFDCDAYRLKGQYVYIMQQSGLQKLTICEVEVYAKTDVNGVLLGESCDEFRMKCAAYDAVCVKGKCTCKENYKHTQNSTYCYQEEVDTRCRSNIECDKKIRFQFCNAANQCSCPVDMKFVISSNTCEPKFSDTNDTCVDDASICDIFGESFCNEDTEECQCKPHFHISEDGLLCIPMTLGKYCDNVDDCKDFEYASCTQHRCLCTISRVAEKKRTPTYFADSNNVKCIQLFIGDPCSTEEGCQSIAHAYCDKQKSVCVCQHNYLLPHDNSYCIERLVGDFCILDSDCILVENSICHEYVCTCQLLHQPSFNNRKCRIVFLSMEWILLVSLLIALIWAFIFKYCAGNVGPLIEQVFIKPFRDKMPKLKSFKGSEIKKPEPDGYHQLKGMATDLANQANGVFDEFDEDVNGLNNDNRKWLNRKQDLLKEFPDITTLVPENHKEYVDKIPDMNEIKNNIERTIKNNEMADNLNKGNTNVPYDSPLDAFVGGLLGKMNTFN